MIHRTARPSNSSLVEDVAAHIVLKHDELNRAVACEPDPLSVNRIVLEIWSLAEEFECALCVDKALSRIRIKARATCAALDGQRPAP